MLKTKEKEEKEKAIPILIFLGLGGGLAAWLLRRRPQPDKAILYGQVTDIETGNGIVGISVDCDGYTGETDSNGNYRIINIEPGTYTVNFTDPSGNYEPAVV